MTTKDLWTWEQITFISYKRFEIWPWTGEPIILSAPCPIFRKKNIPRKSIVLTGKNLFNSNFFKSFFLFYVREKFMKSRQKSAIPTRYIVDTIDDFLLKIWKQNLKSNIRVEYEFQIRTFLFVWEINRWTVRFKQVQAVSGRAGLVYHEYYLRDQKLTVFAAHPMPQRSKLSEISCCWKSRS